MKLTRTDLMTAISAVAVVVLAVAGSIEGATAIAFIIGSVMKSPISRP